MNVLSGQRPLIQSEHWARFFLYWDMHFLYRQSLISGISGFCWCSRCPTSQSATRFCLKRLPSLTMVQWDRSPSRTPFCRFITAVVGDCAGRWLEPVAPQFRVVQWTGELFHRLTLILHLYLVSGRFTHSESANINMSPSNVFPENGRCCCC